MEGRTDAEDSDSEFVRIITFNQVVNGLLPIIPYMLRWPEQADTAPKTL